MRLYINTMKILQHTAAAIDLLSLLFVRDGVNIIIHTIVHPQEYHNILLHNNNA